MFVDLSSHSSRDDDSISSDSDADGVGGEKMGGVPNVISHGISPD